MPPEEPPACAPDFAGRCVDQCPQGLQCAPDCGACVEDPCAQVDCAIGEYCLAGNCVPRDPNCNPAGDQCDDTCPAGESCSEGCGFCRPDDPCANVDCAVGERCEAGQCVPTGIECGFVDGVCEGSCPQGERCDRGCNSCEPDPCAQVDCAVGERCEEGQCVPFGFECVFLEGLCDDACPQGQMCDPTCSECVLDPCANVDCAIGELCREGACVPLDARCNNSEGICEDTCPAGEMCDSSCVTCMPDPCAQVDCAVSERCIEGICRPADPECNTVGGVCDDQCPGEMICNVDCRICVEPACIAVDCAPGDVCRGGVCEPVDPCEGMSGPDCPGGIGGEPGCNVNGLTNQCMANCAAGEICNAACDACVVDLCAAVDCGLGERCEEGLCVIVGGGIGVDGNGPDHKSAENSPSGGICAAAPGESPDAPWFLALLLALPLARRRRG